MASIWDPGSNESRLEHAGDAARGEVPFAGFPGVDPLCCDSCTPALAQRRVRVTWLTACQSPILLPEAQLAECRAAWPPQTGAAAYPEDADRGILQNMSSVPIDIPEATLVALKLDAAEAAAELRMAAAMKLFELGRLSSGAAAELAGVPRVAFLAKLNDFGVETFQQTQSDLASDLANA